jgi:hypothetical protein
MFTRNARPLLALAAILVGGATVGCETRLDPGEYGEIITKVPSDLNRPFPLPELDEHPAGEPQPTVPEKEEPEIPK